jgi:hypothetical protein
MFKQRLEHSACYAPALNTNAHSLMNKHTLCATTWVQGCTFRSRKVPCVRFSQMSSNVSILQHLGRP